MDLLEQDVHDKRDIIDILRHQLEEVKDINLGMNKQLTECQSTLEHRTHLLSKMEIQKAQMTQVIQRCENR